METEFFKATSFEELKGKYQAWLQAKQKEIGVFRVDATTHTIKQAMNSNAKDEYFFTVTYYVGF
jgi:hypothetical protein